METIMRSEWERKHPDFKTVDDDGQHFVLRLETQTGATVLEPVEIVEEEADE